MHIDFGSVFDAMEWRYGDIVIVIIRYDLELFEVNELENRCLCEKL